MTITKDIRYIGVNDHAVDLFEGQYVVPGGMCYNSYAIVDEKVAIMDTVDRGFTHQWLDNIQNTLGGRKPDYLVVQHMEPDHSANIANFLKVYPEATVVSSAKAFVMMKNFFGDDYADRRMVVGEGDTLCLGKHTLTFVGAPMVHWPEAMVTYDAYDKVLFSADAFGTFGALNGNVFADEVNFKEEWLDDARRYLVNIVGKYGGPVQSALKKALTLDIAMICPLHGPIWREDLGWFIDKYQKWSTYTPEDHNVVVMYASIYGNTENAADVLAGRLADAGEKNVKVYDVSVTDPSYLVAEAFRCDRIVFACPTYNAGLFPKMETLLHELAAHNLQKRKVAVLENGTWASTAGKQMKEILSGMKDMEIYEETVTVKSALKEDQLAQLDKIVEFMTK